MAGIFRRTESIVARKIADEVFLVPVKGKIAEIQRMFVLNTVGECIWNHLEAARTHREIVGAVLAAFDVDETAAAADVDEFLQELRGAGLVEEL